MSIINMGRLFIPSSRRWNHSNPSEISMTLQPGTYCLEVWGAQGGGTNGGRGGYAKAYIRLLTSRVVWLYPGQRPTGLVGGNSGNIRTGGNSENAARGAGGGMSFISFLRYQPPIPPGTVITPGAMFTHQGGWGINPPLSQPAFVIGDASAETVTLEFGLMSTLHGMPCGHNYVTVNNVIVTPTSVQHISGDQFVLAPVNNAGSNSGHRGYVNQTWLTESPLREVSRGTVTLTGLTPGDQIGVRTFFGSGHSPPRTDITLTDIVSGMDPVPGTDGDMFQNNRLPLIVAGGGGGQGVTGGSPSGTRPSTGLANRFFGRDSQFGGSGSGFQAGLIGTASLNPGGGTNYGHPTDLFNYRHENGVREGNGLIRISRISR